ncbi:MAG: hypothetical protein LBL36_03360 [Clostridiales Family XIII bacterium]|jgi:hypothetical protein|nr:hypothetical protein [Clostridiales Family XIII bacterium]
MFYYYLCAFVTLVSAAVSFAFSAYAHFKSKSQKDTASLNAKYAMSRSFSLFVVAIGLFIFISDPYLITLAIVMIGIQLFDGIIGIKISAFKTMGPLLTAIGNALVLILFMIK